MPILSAEYQSLRVDDLIPYPENPRVHSEKQVWEIVNIIKQVGYITDIVVDEGDMILSGHGRALAAQKMGLEVVPCKRIIGLSDIEKRAYVVADNKIALNSTWDEELLKVNLDELMASDDIDMGSFGFTFSELKDLEIEAIPEFVPNLPDNKEGRETKEKDITLIVKFESEEAQQTLFDELRDRGYRVKV